MGAVCAENRETIYNLEAIFWAYALYKYLSAPIILNLQL